MVNTDEKIKDELPEGSGPDPFEVFKEGEILVDSKDEAVGLVVRELQEFLKRSYGREGRNPLEYHAPPHSYDVAIGVDRDLREIKGIDPDPSLINGELSDWFPVFWGHDLIMRSGLRVLSEEQPDLLVRLRIRGAKPEDLEREGNEAIKKFFEFDEEQEINSVSDIRVQEDEREKVIGGNEYASATLIYYVLQRYKFRESGENVFKLSHEEIVDMVSVTYPEFMPKDVDGVIGLYAHQPYLKPEVGVGQLALALRDLKGYAGASSYDVYRNYSDAEFREINVYISRILKEKAMEDISVDQRAEIAASILGWARSAGAFVRLQEMDFERIINENAKLAEHPKVKGYFEGVYTRFQENAKMCDERFERLNAEYGDEKEYYAKKKEGSGLSETGLYKAMQDPARFWKLLREFEFEV